MSEQQPTTDPQLRSAWLIWLLMTTTVIVLVVLILLFGEPIRASIKLELPLIWLRTVFYLAAFITFLLINLQRRVMLHPSYYRTQQTEPTKHCVSQRYRTVVMLSLALAASIALLGVLLYLVGDSRQTVGIFSLLSLLALIRYRPKSDELNRLTQSLEQQS